MTGNFSHIRITETDVFKNLFPILCLIYFKNVSETGPSAASHKEVMKLRRDNQNLSEENNLLKLKIDILLDMVR